MNPNSFPNNKESIPDSQEGVEQKYPSFEEHMESIEGDPREFNFSPSPAESHSDDNAAEDELRQKVLDSYESILSDDQPTTIDFIGDDPHSRWENQYTYTFNAQEQTNPHNDDMIIVDKDGHEIPFHSGRAPIDKAFEQSFLRSQHAAPEATPRPPIENNNNSTKEENEQ